MLDKLTHDLSQNEIKLTRLTDQDLDSLFVGTAKPDAELYRITFADTETTGLDFENDRLTQFTGIKVTYDYKNQELVSLDHVYDGYNDPGIPIPEQISKMTGITNEMVKGKSIGLDVLPLWDTDFLLCHNMNFDFNFMSKYMSVPFSKMRLGCTRSFVNWRDQYGVPAANQVVLALFLCKYYHSHNALFDTKAMIYITHTYKVLNQIIDEAKKDMFRVEATSSPYNSKDILRERGYRWGSALLSDAKPQVWSKFITTDQVMEELEFLTNKVYEGDDLADIQEIPQYERFK